MGRTIAEQLEFKGTGLHSGAECRVILSPSSEKGIRFKTENGIYGISEAVVEEDQRLTGFVFPDGTKIRTAEHLLAAVSGMGIDDLLIESFGGEIPILDGSASVFAEAISETGCTGEKDRRVSAVSVPFCVDEGKRCVFAMPSDVLRITYIIDYSGTPIGVQKISYEINEKTFEETISRARTFCLTAELDYLKANGLAQGGSLDCAMVFAQDRMLNESGLRFPNECATHKVLDLMGDLTLLGVIPTAHYVAVCAGHAVHDKLVAKLKRALIFD